MPEWIVTALLALNLLLMLLLWLWLWLWLARRPGASPQADPITEEALRRGLERHELERRDDLMRLELEDPGWRDA